MARILYFAGLVDRLGLASEEADVPAGVSDVRGFLAWLRQRGGKWEQYLADDAVRVTVNRQFATAETPIANANEIALINIRPL